MPVALEETSGTDTASFREAPVKPERDRVFRSDAALGSSTAWREAAAGQLDAGIRSRAAHSPLAYKRPARRPL